MAETELLKVTPRVGLLLATRNQGPLLEQAIRSLLLQTYPHFSLTIVNDGSTDETDQILQGFDDTRIQVLRSSGQGFIPSLNQALTRGKPANYYMVVYANCHYDPHFLERMMQVMLEKLKFGGAYCNYNVFLVDNGRQYQCFTETAYRQSDLLSRNSIGIALLFRRELLKPLGDQFLPSSLGLWETWQQMAAQSDFVSLPETLVQCRYIPDEYSAFTQRPPDYQPTRNLSLLKLNCRFAQPQEGEALFQQLLQQDGHHWLGPSERSPADLIVAASVDQLEAARALTFHHQAPVVLLLNDMSQAHFMLQHQRVFPLLLPIYTHQPEIAQMVFSQSGKMPVLYRPGMPGHLLTSRLARTPGLLNRHRTTIIVRTYTHSDYLEVTLASLFHMNQLASAFELVVMCVEASYQTINWVRARKYPCSVALQPTYHEHLATLLSKTDSFLVLFIDAGITISPNWWLATSPLLWDPLVIQVTTLLQNSCVPDQRLPFTGGTQAEMHRKWLQYRARMRGLHTRLPQVSDSLFLARKDEMIHLLQSHPEVNPILKPDSFSLLLREHNLTPLMTAEAYALSLI